MVRVVPVPAKLIVRLVVRVAVPVPRLRLFADVLALVPKVKEPKLTNSLFVRVIAAPLVLLSVPAVRVSVPALPVPMAEALFRLSVPAVRVVLPV
jgi:hypothetical protein